MAGAIIGGLIAQGVVDRQNLYVADPWETTVFNIEACKEADLVLAVKPQVTKTVCQELGKAWADRSGLPVVVSIAAGITLSSMKEWLRTKDDKVEHVVRAMRNTPALLGEGASGLFAGAEVTAAERDMVHALLGSVSKVVPWVDSEELLNVVTTLSGGAFGAAYFFNLVEILVASTVELGLPEEQATQLIAQTCLGAGRMLVESSDGPSQLRSNVTSPNGTTHAALQSLAASGFGHTVNRAVKAAAFRAAELSNKS
ncbi:hypothetical protein VE02_07881 [Pseudogymnoascus sp. 03VT05]|nr:hypothetical protein VE02_07881 [Pseudogymnoascus sp. 03VT05]